MKKLVVLLLVSAVFSCKKQIHTYTSENLKVKKIKNQVYQQISYIDTETWGKVPCNGIVVVDNGEALIIDAPTTKEAATELIDFVENTLHYKIKGVVATHFHKDCLGSLAVFHKNNIPSYANELTLQLAKENNETIPQHGFTNKMTLQVGKEEVDLVFLGEGHTKDNIVAYFPEEKTLFGGCLLKSINAKKGHLADANINDWSATVTKVKENFPKVTTVIPGHGKIGNQELLDYTITLFAPNTVTE